MTWIDYWPLLVVFVAAVVIVIINIRNFSDMPSEEQVEQVKQWLLLAVTNAEKELGAGTGALKLRYVYDQFLQIFPDVSEAISFELFAGWVDEVLVTMRHLIETNKNIKAYVEG